MSNVIKRAIPSIMFIPIKNIRNKLSSNKLLSIIKINTLIKQPIDLDIKKVCTPNIKIPTIPLNNPTYFAPFPPMEVLRITGNGNPYFCEGLPIKFEKIKTNNEAITDPDNTIKIFKSYNI